MAGARERTTGGGLVLRLRAPTAVRGAQHTTIAVAYAGAPRSDCAHRHGHRDHDDRAQGAREAGAQDAAISVAVRGTLCAGWTMRRPLGASDARQPSRSGWQAPRNGRGPLQLQLQPAVAAVAMAAVAAVPWAFVPVAT